MKGPEVYIREIDRNFKIILIKGQIYLRYFQKVEIVKISKFERLYTHTDLDTSAENIYPINRDTTRRIVYRGKITTKTRPRFSIRSLPRKDSFF